MKKSRYVYLSLYYGDAVYEPAEGGYYVPIRRLSKAVRMSYHHARRLIRQYRAAMEREGCLTGYDNHTVYFNTSHWSGQPSDMYVIEGEPGSHEELYHGYC